MKIGFYDSGLGGIKTLKDIIDMGLAEEIYFLADEKNKPYGTKSVEEVRKIARENVKRLIDLGCKIIVVACNTATSVAIEDLRKEFPNIDIIGTEPAVKLAVSENLHKKVLIIATTVTVNGEKLHKLIISLEASQKIELLPADKLVTLIEDENFLHNPNEPNNNIEKLIKPYDLESYSHIILGCTHFPLVKNNIEEVLKSRNCNIKVIDGNQGIGRNLLKKVSGRNDKTNKLTIHIISTLNNKAFGKRINEILKNIEYDYISD